jgi:hypothetical protein
MTGHFMRMKRLDPAITVRLNPRASTLAESRRKVLTRICGRQRGPTARIPTKDLKLNLASRGVSDQRSQLKVPHLFTLPLILGALDLPNLNDLNPWQ